MEQNEFYWVVPSNVDDANHPNNTTALFTVTLQTPITLQGEWEVGVVAAYFPEETRLINDSNSTCAVRTTHGTRQTDVYYNIPALNQLTPLEVIARKWLNQSMRGIVHSQFTNDKRVKLKTFSDVDKLLLSGEIVKLLGYKDADLTRGVLEVGNSYKIAADAFQSSYVSHVYITCNLIKEIDINDFTDQLLLHFSLRQGGTVQYRPIQVQYFPLSYKCLS